MDKTSIAILGTRGIPNRYGGFEQCAECLGVGLSNCGFDVTVYNPHWHTDAGDTYRGVRIVRKWCPENTLGAAAHFVYDYLCLRDALGRRIDIILELGYQSAAISYVVCGIDKAVVVTNMDGLEWKREKWNAGVKALTRWFEKLAATRSHFLIADNPGIQDYLKDSYGKESFYIPYGANIVDQVDEQLIRRFGVRAGAFYLVIARFEPENNFQMILDGYQASGASEPILLIGNADNGYGTALRKRFERDNVKFLGGIYDADILNSLRHFSRLYFHGHSVGGTNPSLLEAMAAGARIRAHDNPFNRSVTKTGALYFTCAADVAAHIFQTDVEREMDQTRVQQNLTRISRQYSWNAVVEKYASCFKEIVDEGSIGYPR